MIALSSRIRATAHTVNLGRRGRVHLIVRARSRRERAAWRKNMALLRGASVVSLSALALVVGCSSALGGGASANANHAPPENTATPVDALTDPNHPGLEACKGSVSSAELEDSLEVASDFKESLHELVVCGGLVTSLGSAVIITRCPPFRTSGSNFCAPAPTSQWPSLVMPMGTASYLSGSRPRITEAAEARETSCSPERPPKRMPTRNRFFSEFTPASFQKRARG
jgi:hypothetical protein